MAAKGAYGVRQGVRRGEPRHDRARPARGNWTNHCKAFAKTACGICKPKLEVLATRLATILSIQNFHGSIYLSVYVNCNFLFFFIFFCSDSFCRWSRLLAGNQKVLLLSGNIRARNWRLTHIPSRLRCYTDRRVPSSRQSRSISRPPPARKN